MKIIVIGGVAGGASAAARLRRNDESAEIVLFERGEYISFANCGLPYHVGEVIQNRDSLLLLTPEAFKGRTGIDVRVLQEVTSIDAKKKTVKIRNVKTGETYSESYDKLIMSPGSSPLVPPLKGVDDPEVMVLWTMPDMDKIKARVDSGIKNAVVIGGGFIGVEVAENLCERGLDVSLVEMLPQILAPLDAEMTTLLNESMIMHGIKMYLDNGVTGIDRAGKELVVNLKNGGKINTDLVIMAVGVRPNSELAKAAGLELGLRGGIVVDKYMQTSNPDIYAVGDAVQVTDLIMNNQAIIPLAGPANRQGRIAANNICGAKEEYKGSLGTSVCKVFNKTAASTGANEKRLKQAGMKYNKLYIHPESNASYYPGGGITSIKVLFTDDGKILGAQAVGEKGVDKRIDVLATAIRNGLTVDDLAELELAYAPPYGSAKDPVNFVGFVAQNMLKGDSKVVYADAIPKGSLIVDVRKSDEFICGSIPESINIPLEELRDRYQELPKNKVIVFVCRVGTRAYLAERALRQKGYNVRNLSGGFATWKHFNPAPVKPLAALKPTPKTPAPTQAPTVNADSAIQLNACGLQCPGPIVSVKKEIDKMQNGQMLKVQASDAGFMSDLPAWCESTGNDLIDIKYDGSIVEALLKKGSDNQEMSVTTTTGANNTKRTTIVMFSNDLDKSLAAMIIASGFASLGHEVSIFFTFWGLNVLRKDNPPPVKKNFISRMFGIMMPRGAKKLALSKMHMMGGGTAMMKYVMNSKNVDSLPVLIEQAREMGVKFLACEMAMDIMGLQKEELLDDVESVGVAKFAALSEKSTTTLFI